METHQINIVAKERKNGGYYLTSPDIPLLILIVDENGEHGFPMSYKRFSSFARALLIHNHKVMVGDLCEATPWQKLVEKKSGALTFESL